MRRENDEEAELRGTNDLNHESAQEIRKTPEHQKDLQECKKSRNEHTVQGIRDGHSRLDLEISKGSLVGLYDQTQATNLI